MGMYKLRIILPFIMLALLTSCSHLNSNFDCPMKDGFRCQSLDQVNDAVDHGEIGMSPGVEEIHEMTVSSYKGNDYLVGLKGSKAPIRDSENVIQIWVAPYEDTHGNYHQASTVYAVSSPGHWLGYPVKEIKEYDYV